LQLIQPDTGMQDRIRGTPPVGPPEMKHGWRQVISGPFIVIYLAAVLSIFKVLSLLARHSRWAARIDEAWIRLWMR